MHDTGSDPEKGLTPKTGSGQPFGFEFPSGTELPKFICQHPHGAAIILVVFEDACPDIGVSGFDPLVEPLNRGCSRWVGVTPLES